MGGSPVVLFDVPSRKQSAVSHLCLIAYEEARTQAGVGGLLGIYVDPLWATVSPLPDTDQSDGSSRQP